MRARTRLLLDIAIACGLIAAYRPIWTGITLHEWISVAIIVPLAIHLVVNWEWCVRIARTFADRLFHASRANFVVDAGLLFASVAVMLSGIMVSPIPPFFGVQPTQLLVWSMLHAWSANAIIALFLVHTVLHRTWVAATAKRLWSERAVPARGRRSASRRRSTPVRAAAAPANSALTPSQIRRAARIAAQKASARRKAGVLGVVTATVAVGSLIFASVAVAGPALSRSIERREAAAASTAATQAATPAISTGTAGTTKKTIAKKTSAKKTAAQTTTVKAAAPAPKPVTQTCPHTGCTATSCHAAHGQSAGTWYATHS
jgi:cytochrome b subunit of formate dehydrogenase